MVTKLLANRLQPLAMDIIDENQYGFIKGRTIQDWVGLSKSYISAITQEGKSSFSSYTLRKHST
jgi:hypothetical protein